MRTFLVIDAGTSSTKLSLVDERGRLVAARAAPCRVEYPRPGWAEQDPEQWWQAVCTLAPELVRHPRARGLAAVALSGQTPLCVPVDAQGRPLGRAMLWLDRRAAPQVEWLRERIGEARCRDVSRNRLDSYFGGVKWLWLRQEDPQRFRQTARILQATSFLMLRLTGETAVDPAQAGLCSPCFHYTRGDWDDDVLDAMGLSRALLPPVRPAWQVTGRVRVEAAEACGLPAGLPVVCGGGDFACALLGAGSGSAVMLGTAGNLLLPGVDSTDARLLHTIHLTGAPLPFGGVLAGGNLEWFASLISDDMPAGRRKSLFGRLDAEAAQVPAGCEGLVFLPYLMGARTPIWDPAARGAFVGLSSRHSRAHLYRAILEGVALAFRQVQEIAGAGGGEPVTAIDGGARSPLWRQILADALRRPVRWSPTGGTAIGAAYLAARGVEYFRDFSGIQWWLHTSEPAIPGVAAERYDEIYVVYARLYEKLRSDFHALA